MTRRTGALARLLSGAALVCAVASGCPAEPARVPFTLLQANVGTSLLACDAPYVYKLCEKSVEDALRENIARLDPDVVALQEVLPDGFCDTLAEPEDDPRFICHPDNVGDEPSQARRLVGPDYQILCDDRHGYECVAARAGVLTGPYLVAPPVESDADEECSTGFSVGSVIATLPGAAGFTLVNGHPQSAFIGACRAKQLAQVFADDGLAQRETLLSGDWNLDPYRAGDDPSVTTWVQFVGPDDATRFHYHSGVAERQPPYPTNVVAGIASVLDHVASTSLEGTCQTLGEAPDTERLDGAVGAGCDHRALFCSLSDLPMPSD